MKFKNHGVLQLLAVLSILYKFEIKSKICVKILLCLKDDRIKFIVNVILKIVQDQH